MSLGESGGGLPPDSVVEDEDGHPGGLCSGPSSDGTIPGRGRCARWCCRHALRSPSRPTSCGAQPSSPERWACASIPIWPKPTTKKPSAWSGSGLDRSRTPSRWGGWDTTSGLRMACTSAPDESEPLASAGTGVAHCPTSNMRLASGIAPVLRYLDQGVPVGLGVDGSASNDASNCWPRCGWPSCLARLSVAPGVGPEGPQLTVRQALRLATRGGAELLGRPTSGRSKWARHAISLGSGCGESWRCPVSPTRWRRWSSARRPDVDLSVVGGTVVVEDGGLLGRPRCRSTPFRPHGGCRALVG